MIDVAVLAAVGSKVAGAAVGRVAGSVAVKKWDRSRLRRALELSNANEFSQNQIEILQELTTGKIEYLNQFLRSPEFFGIAKRYVVQLIHADKTAAHADAERQLEQLLRLHVGLNHSESEAVCGAILELIEPTIDTYLLESQHSSVLPKNFAGAALPLAAANKAIGDHNYSILEALNELAPVRKFACDYIDQIRFVDKEMPIPSSTTHRRAPYSRLYVEPTLRLQDGSFVEMSTLLSRSTVPRLVVKGDPGGGKSTLVYKLALDIAERTARSGGRGLVPFVLTLRKHAHSIVRENNTIVRQLELLCQNPYQLDPPEHAVEYLLLNSQAFVIFDGLDELTDVTLREDLVRAVHAFSNRYVDTPVIVTSRRIGYERSPMDASVFKEVDIGTMTDRAVKQFVTNWFHLDETVPMDTRRVLARSFIQVTQPIPDLRCNPLILSLMCSLYSHENWIPNNRPSLYEKCSEYLFQLWDLSRSLTSREAYRDARPSLYTLALWMLDEDKNQEGIPRRLVVQFLISELYPRRFEDVDEAKDAANDFLDFCTGRAWILSDIGADTLEPYYGFTHRTFLEYFAAKQVARTNPTVDSLYATLATSIGEGGREVVAQICLQIQADREVDGADAFLGLVLQDDQDVRTPDRPVPPRLTFAVRSLQFVQPTPSMRRSITARLLDDVQALTRADPSDSEALRRLPSIQDLLCSDITNLPSIASTIADYFSALEAFEIGAPLLTLLVYPRAIAAAHPSLYSPSTHGRFWTERQEELRQIAHRKLAGVYEAAPWWTLHLWAYGIKESFAIRPTVSIPMLFQQSLVPGTVSPPFTYKLLCSMTGGTEDQHEDDVRIGQDMRPIDAIELTRAIVGMGCPYHRVGGRQPSSGPHRIYSLESESTSPELLGLKVLLTVIEADWRYAIGDPLARSAGPVEYWHTITDNEFRDIPWNELPVSLEIRRLMQSWLGSALRTIE